MPEPSPAIYIHAAAALGPRLDYLPEQRTRLTADPEPLSCSELARRVTGQPLRQASHFVELAATGAQLCLQRATGAARDCGVYFGTGLADVRSTVALFQQVLAAGPGYAAPFDFINATSNTAAFYVARLAGLRSRNLTVSQAELSFEWALRLACRDLQSGDLRHALAGGADENSHTRAQHLRRIALRNDQIMGEGSGWLYLSTDAGRALGEVLGVEFLPFDAAPDHGAWAERVAAHIRAAAGGGAVHLLPGFRLAAPHLDALSRRLQPASVIPYMDYCGAYHTAAAFGLALLFDRPRDESALYFHVNGDDSGHTAVIGLRAFAAA